MGSREIIRRLMADGWTLIGQEGSHMHFRHPEKPGKVAVPAGRKDVPIGTVKAIGRQSGLKFD